MDGKEATMTALMQTQKQGISLKKINCTCASPDYIVYFYIYTIQSF